MACIRSFTRQLMASNQTRVDNPYLRSFLQMGRCSEELFFLFASLILIRKQPQLVASFRDQTHENQEKNLMRKDPKVLKLHICYMFFSIGISHFCYWTQWRSLSQLRVSVSGMDRIHPVMVRMRLSRWFEDTWGRKNMILSKLWCITRIRIHLVTSQFFVVVMIRWIRFISVSYHHIIIKPTLSIISITSPLKQIAKATYWVIQ